MKYFMFLSSALLALPRISFAHVGTDDYAHHSMMDWGMGWGGGGLFGLGMVTWIIWSVVGILAAIWLWQQIKK